MLPGPRKFQDPMSQSDFEEMDIRLPESLSSEKELAQAFQYFISRYSLALNGKRQMVGVVLLNLPL